MALCYNHHDKYGGGIMIARVILGILVGYLLIAYFPLIMRRGLPYIFVAVLIAIAVYCLRAAPMLAEPLGYGLLVVLVLYLTYLIIWRRGWLKEIAARAKQKKLTLPVIKIAQHQQLSMILTLILYTLGLTFVSYLLILIICVR